MRLSDYKVFIGLSEIAGYYSSLHRGLNEIGMKCDFYTQSFNRFDYKVYSKNLFQNFYNYLARKKEESSDHKRIKRIIVHLLMFINTLMLFIYCIFKYNVFIFGFKASFFPQFDFIDLKILSSLKKRVICVFNGSDARPPFIDGFVVSEKLEENVSELIKLVKKQKVEFEKIEKFSDVRIIHPATAHFAEKEIVSFLHIGIPMFINHADPVEVKSASDQITILHCPSVLKAKGTYQIRKAIIDLQKKGHQIKYIEISNQPNKVVLETLKKCDFVIDQIYSTSPMPGFVTEAASFGKPAVICGYYYNAINKILPERKIPPSHFCHPDELVNGVEKLILDRNYRVELGRRAYDFVATQWNPKKVAARFIKVIGNEFPNDWIYNPKDIKYVHGAGISESKARQVVKAMLEHGGKPVLQLSDKPDLERLFVDFAYTEKVLHKLESC